MLEDCLCEGKRAEAYHADIGGGEVFFDQGDHMGVSFFPALMPDHGVDVKADGGAVVPGRSCCPDSLLEGCCEVLFLFYHLLSVQRPGEDHVGRVFPVKDIGSAALALELDDDVGMFFSEG